jgi:hypothetical protein
LPRCASGELFCGVSGHKQGNLPLKGVHPCAAVTLPHFLPTAAPFRLRALRAPLDLHSSAAVVAMTLLDPPECFQSEVALNLVHNLLRWGASAFVGRIRVGASPLGDLRRWGVCALCLQPPLRVGATNLVFLRAAAGGARPPTSALHAPLHPLGGHFRLPQRDVCGGDTSSASIRTKGCCAATFRWWKTS